MKLLSLLSTGAVLALAALFVAAPSTLAATSVPEATSENWAGYVAGDASAGSFSRVSGSWVQPSADPNAGDGYSAFWVGLGGAGQSQSLEQIGTQADVSGGQTIYYAWYELVPSAPVTLALAINPGDHISASVSVSGTNVTVSLSDQTTGSSFTHTLQMSNPDTSSAEWIAEAPSAEDGNGNMQPVPLADFGSVNFTAASATAGGHAGAIFDPGWNVQAVQLNGTNGGAQPGALSSDGTSFSVSWQGAADGAAYGGGAGYGYGYGYGGYGYGGYSPPPDGYGPPGYGYGY